MESATKNKQTDETLYAMVHHIFPDDDAVSFIELTEGYFNVVYAVTQKSGRTLILKIAPPPTARIMTYEKNIMESEVAAMKTIYEAGHIPVPRVYGFDSSRTICSSPYFFMEKLAGKSLNSIRSQLTVSEIQTIHEESGRINRLINAIPCPCFGYPGQREFQGHEWFDVFFKMLNAALSDVHVGNIDLRLSVPDLLRMYAHDRPLFEAVHTPCLVHWDCWDGNIFIQDKKITGIIDWERCLWADPLMEVGFRTYEPHEAFQKGYGMTSLSDTEYRRALWYDVYALILMTSECEYRHYDTMDMYNWAVTLLGQQVAKLKN